MAIFVVLPIVLASFIALLLKDYPKAVKGTALLGSLVSLALAILIFMNPPGAQSINWFNVAGTQFNITTMTAPLNLILLMLVAVMTVLIFAYSTGFMNMPSEQPRFYFEMGIFAAAMMLFAIAGSFITVFIAWEMLGVTSYLLIGFWYAKEGAADAARKAITTIIIGDIAMLAAIIVLWNSYGTFEFSALLSIGSPGAPLAIAMALIAVAAFTKSAQFPFHEWLPDAMAGPTPVSAFLHSSTMVKAGVFLIAVLLPLFALANLLYLLVAIGAITATIGVLNALPERNIKRILAYSTIEDLGLMFIALGFNALFAAMMLFIVQTFYKALLFMNAGVVIKANNGEEDIYRVYGTSKNKLLTLMAIISVASIAGIVPFGGFFGKAAIEEAASGTYVYWILLALELGSALYIFRWLFVPLRRTPDKNVQEIRSSYKVVPFSMRLAIYMLAAITLVSGSAYYLVPEYFHSIGYEPISLESLLLGSALVITAFVLAFFAYYKFKISFKLANHKALYAIVYNNIMTNKVYDGVAAAFGVWAAKAFGYFDYALDKTTYALSGGVIAFGNAIKKIESGQMNLYAAMVLIGVIAILIMLML